MLPSFWLVVFPLSRRELRTWRQRARQIPDPSLRAHALRKLDTEHLTAECAAGFALMGTPRALRHVVRFCVAFEVAYDYLDALGEQPAVDMLASNRSLYAALVSAVSPSHALDLRRDDGGYLEALVAACRTSLAALPGHRHTLPALHRLTQRAAEAQSLHHAAMQHGERMLEGWADRQPERETMDWWELAAAGGSPLGVYALGAAAAHANLTCAQARIVEQAYFPWIAALSWLLEGLVDIDEDLAAGSRSYLVHYPSAQTMAQRLATIAARALGDARALPHGVRHTFLLTGMASMYLSHAQASASTAREAAEHVRRATGGLASPLLLTLRIRRRIAARGRSEVDAAASAAQLRVAT